MFVVFLLVNVSVNNLRDVGDEPKRILEPTAFQVFRASFGRVHKATNYGF